MYYYRLQNKLGFQKRKKGKKGKKYSVFILCGRFFLYESVPFAAYCYIYGLFF
jgi:hypothetical protein